MANEVKARRWLLRLGVVVGLLVAVAGIGLTRVDAWTQSRLQQEADALGARLGRSVQLGAVHSHLWRGVLDIDSLQVGPAAGESAPLLVAGPLHGTVGRDTLLRSLGRVINVHAVEVHGLTLNVERRVDGRTNLDEVARAWNAALPPPSPGMPGGPSRLVDARIGFVTLDGQVRLLAPSTPELQLATFVLKLEELRIGHEMTMRLNASVLSPSPNLEAYAETAQLQEGNRPRVELLKIKLAPTALEKLAPYFPQGPRAGTLQADLTSDLGALVRNGTGLSHIVGKVEAHGLRLGDATQPLEALLDLDVAGDARRGDVALQRFLLKLGAAELVGHGEARGLLTRTPEVNGLELVAHHLDPGLIAQHYPPLREALAGVTGPLALSLEAVGGQEHPGLMLNVDAREVAIVRPHAFTKAAGAPLRLTLRANGGIQGILQLEGNADLAGLDLRPGGRWNKPPDVPLQLSFTGGYRPILSGSTPAELTLTTLRLEARSDVLSGSAHIFWAGGALRDVDASLSGTRLNLDELLLPPAPPQSAVAQATPGSATAAAPRHTPPPEAHARITVGSLRFKETDFTNVDAQAVWTDDTLHFSHLGALVHGGSVSLDGTQLAFGSGPPSYNLRARASGLEMSALLPRTVKPDLVTGTFSGTVALEGRGLDRASLSRTLSGTIEGKVMQGTFKGGDLVAQLAGPLAKALSLDTSSLAGQVTSLGRELPFGLRFGGGVAKLSRPLLIQNPHGTLTLEGSIQLEGKLALQGNLALAPEAVSQLTRGQVNVSTPVPVGFKVTGPVSSPQVTDLELGEAIKVLANHAANGGLKALLGNDPKAVENRKKLEEKAKEKLQQLRGLLGKPRTD